MIERGIRGAPAEVGGMEFDEYGIDWDGPAPERGEEDEDGYDDQLRQVVVLPSRCPLSEPEFQFLQNQLTLWSRTKST